MNVQVVEVRDGKKFNCYGEEIIACTICGGPTTMKGTELCDRCWELDRRIRGDLILAERILNFYKNG